jgi:uncharacterized membrane protein YtjA (UPF0391 family)
MALISRRNVIILFVVDVVLFVIANVEYNHHRRVSNVAWVAFIIGVVLLIVLSVMTLVRSRGSRAR